MIITNREVKKNEEPLIAINSGYTFHKEDKVWILDKNVRINVSLVLSVLDESSHQGFLDTLACFATTRSSYYTKRLFSVFYDYIKSTKNGVATDDSIRNYHQITLLTKPEHIASIRTFLKKWLNLGYPGISEWQVEYLHNGIPKKRQLGEAVRVRDQRKGPLSENEVINFNEGAMWLYDAGEITLDELAMALITSYTGRRAIQTSHLKLKDIVSLFQDVGTDYFINFPRAKHSGAFRSEFTPLKITEDLHDIIVILSEKSIRVFESFLGREVNTHEVKEIPLFIDPKSFNEKFSDKKLLALLKKDIFHIRARDITMTIKKIAKKIGFLDSESTIHARRFRYSLGTRAAQEGFSEYVIAALLDHRSIMSVGFYVKNIPEYAARIDEVITAGIIQYVNAFKGKLIEKDSGYKKVKNHDGVDSGNCANCKSCGAPVPVPCYTCIHFQPWVDGPHQSVHDYLVNERNRIATITSDVKITTSLDRTINAVGEVILKCDEIKKKRGDTCQK
ncbi:MULTISPECIES: site-specific integrase [Enterobacterales]|uniref:site-specific integrase n=1 Tax=Enterobacterales TaxID=91347 RepID=UPI000C7D6107|nr:MULTISPECIES: site-specific integrase [Enterobacterales]HBX1662928.1 site-specific integrase [Klebsiella quasipneumoniae subsp. similipneumoniae]HCT5764305.1 site-specific integrase [Klebsiella variicola]HDS6437972.1 site-specific integrase [Enterobacter hormaechei subsp. steigerwaltii]EKV3653125.1 site-specific integrase [Klebsiella quasipneumoniae]MBD0756504.1 site-specific integrase [Klebsiella quasipneumoniae]